MISLQIKRGVSADWSSENPVLKLGELGYVTDMNVLKIGDGVTDFVTLNPYGGVSGSTKLDDLAAPDDNTDLNASTTAHGLCPKGTNTGTQFLKDDLTWDTPAGTVTYGVTAGTACEGNDPRLSDTRVPIAHNHILSDISDITLPGTATVYWDGTGNFSTPNASGSVFKPGVYIGGTGSGADYECDGTADDAEIQAAITTLSTGGTIFFLQGNYQISAQINLLSKISFVGLGNVTFIQTFAGKMFSTGSENYSSNTILLVSDASPATRNPFAEQTIALTSVTGLLVDDWIKINDTTHVNIDTTDYFSGEIVRIVAIDTGSNIITVDRKLYESYATADTACVRKIAMWQDIKFENITFVGYGIDTAAIAIAIYGGYNIKINNCKFTDFGVQGIALVDCLESVLRDCIFKNIYYVVEGNGIGYGIGLANACDNITIDNCKFKEKGRHYIAFGANTGGNTDGGYLYGLRVINCDFENSTEEAINFHENTHGNVLVNGCKFNGCGKGVEVWNNKHTIISNNLFINCANPIETYLEGSTTLITGNVFKNFGMLYLLSDTDVIGNTFDGAGYISNETSTYSFANKITVSGNVFHNYVTYGIYTNGGPAIFDIRNNEYHGDKSDLFALLIGATSANFSGNLIDGGIEIQSSSGVVIRGNDIDSSGYGIRIRNAAGNHNILNNHVTGTTRGISLEETTAGNASVINIRRNYISSSAPVYNEDTKYSALDDDTVRI